MSALIIASPFAARRAAAAQRRSSQPAGRRRRRPDWLPKAFTLIELLIVILILAILMAVAMPMYIGAVADSERKACRANMQTIANAEQVYKLSNPTHKYTTDLSALYSNTGIHVACPILGTSAYTVEISDGSGVSGTGQTVPAGGLIIHCADADHGSWAPGVDSE